MAKFTKGKSGNTAGRPRGIVDKRTKYREALQEHGDAIIKTLVENALAGDSTALRICADRIIPSLKASDAPVNIQLTGGLSEQGQRVIESLGSGALSPGETATVMAALHAQARLIEADELVSRIERLEEANGKRSHPA